MPAALPHQRPIFLTGATGYIGGRLAPALLEQGWQVRCLTRSAQKLAARPWAGDPRVEIIEGDAGDGELLARAMRGCGAAYYLVHSMITVQGAYARRDVELATLFAQAAERAGVERLIYLGGLGEAGRELSEHLSSRRETARALGSTSVPLTTLQAAIIIGSGSASSEILRYVVERLPIMVTPRWVRTESQPIAVRNVLHYLTACLDVPETIGRTLDIGGPQIVTYLDLMRQMAEALGLPRRLIVPVPVLTPRLSSLWLHLVTPVNTHLSRALVEGLRNRVVCRDDEAARLMPQRLLTVRESIDAALGTAAEGQPATSWSDAGPMPGDPDWAGGTTYTDERSIEVAAPPERVFRAVCRIGGGQGYYAVNWLWRMRGWLDTLAGGPGLRRGRRHPDQVAYGDALDFWRVTRVERPRALELRAEMRLPGVAELDFEIQPIDGGRRSRLVQRARFKPKGLAGILYWHSILPLHSVVFRGMLRGVARAAEQREVLGEPGDQDADAQAGSESGH